MLRGDSQPGNTYIRDGNAGLLDWQVVRRGHSSRDLALRDLLDTYRSAQAGQGGPDLDRDELWTRYRHAVVHPWFSGLGTASLGGMQDDGIAMEGLLRAVTALEELDTVGALRHAR
ncbi:hypothetical protein MSAR_34850 [Mycolicibacterium sarraceniae]|uniref:Aminoglycoside phosphotransferase n=1 Tax=Mycolicibacterium sarraceniae TaxID=1534348 RepID=A0A7I7SW03_9MYCO|nr:hypothetical protein MSAR_34850 [Mycolicibacterium sarraceniae]